MAKKVSKKFKVHAVAGQASPKPPLGPMLGQNGINIGQFVTEYNGKTQDFVGGQYAWTTLVVPAIITLYVDKSFDVDVLSPLTSSLVAWKAKAKDGSGTPNTDKVGTITKADLMEIAEIKKDSMNTDDMDALCKSIAGTAKNMGVEVK